MSLSGDLLIRLNMNLSSALDLSTPADIFNYRKEYSITNGEGVNQAEQLFTDQRNLAASASEELDLAGGLTNGLGVSLTFTKIKGIFIYAHSTNTNNVLVGGAAANGFFGMFSDATDILVLQPDAKYYHDMPSAAGVPVTAGTGDLLKIANSGGGTAVDYDIILWGCV